MSFGLCDGHRSSHDGRGDGGSAQTRRLLGGAVSYFPVLVVFEPCEARPAIINLCIIDWTSSCVPGGRRLEEGTNEGGRFLQVTHVHEDGFVQL